MTPFVTSVDTYMSTEIRKYSSLVRLRTVMLLVIYLLILGGCAGLSTGRCLTCAISIWNATENGGTVYQDIFFGSDGDVAVVANAFCAERRLGPPQIGPKTRTPRNQANYEYNFNCAQPVATASPTNPIAVRNLAGQCVALGFERDTPDFGNCVIRLLEIENSRANQSATQSETALQQFRNEQAVRQKAQDRAIQTLQQLQGAGSRSSPNQSGVAVLKRSYISGKNRICVYDRVGSEDVITISATAICPLAR
jgi:hypothetical protein